MSSIAEDKVRQILQSKGTFLSHLRRDEAQKTLDTAREKIRNKRQRKRIEVAKKDASELQIVSEGSESEADVFIDLPELKQQENKASELLRKEVRRQSYLRVLPHHSRIPDLETRLRRVATLGIVQLFNTICQGVRSQEATNERDSSGTKDMWSSDDDDNSLKKGASSMKGQNNRKFLDLMVQGVKKN